MATEIEHTYFCPWCLLQGLKVQMQGVKVRDGATEGNEHCPSCSYDVVCHPHPGEEGVYVRLKMHVGQRKEPLVASFLFQPEEDPRCGGMRLATWLNHIKEQMIEEASLQLFQQGDYRP